MFNFIEIFVQTNKSTGNGKSKQKGCKQKVFVAIMSRKSDDREQNTTMSKSTE